MPPRRPLGRTGLEVFPLSLGGNVFGWSADEQTSHAILDAYAAAGGNLIDTANSYSGWVRGNRGGESETIIGSWLKGRGRRDDVLIVSKCGMVPKGLRRDDILREVDGSLRRLGVDRIDVFYAHEDDPATPLEETLGAFSELVEQGVLGVIGASNYTGARLDQALRVADERGLARFAVLQPRYHLLDRADYEGEPQRLALAEGLGVCPYSAVASGFLSGKYRPGMPAPRSVRAGGVMAHYANARGFAALAAVDRVAEAHDATPAQVAIAWSAAQPGVTAPIASATSVAQLEELLGAVALELSADELAALDAAAA